MPDVLWPEAVKHANRLRIRLPSSRINGEIQIKRWDVRTQVDYKSLLEFGTPGLAFHIL